MKLGFRRPSLQLSLQLRPPQPFLLAKLTRLPAAPIPSTGRTAMAPDVIDLPSPPVGMRVARVPPRRVLPPWLTQAAPSQAHGEEGPMRRRTAARRYAPCSPAAASGSPHQACTQSCTSGTPGFSKALLV